MRETIVLTGMVLSATPIGDYDKRVTLLTKERGKINAFVKGAMRQGSQMSAAANPFAFGEFDVYEGRSSYTVLRARISNYFRELSEDYEAVCYGSYFLEIADYYARENTEELQMLKLLYQSLRALQKPSLPNRLVRRVFELKAMVINGEYPNVFSCMDCGKETDLAWYSPAKGGAVCAGCHRAGESRFASRLGGEDGYAGSYMISGDAHADGHRASVGGYADSHMASGDAHADGHRASAGGYANSRMASGGEIAMDGSTLYAMQFIVTATVEKLYTFAVSEEVLLSLERIMEAHMRAHMDRQFKSLEVLEESL